jgi:ubiquinone/menaquinone biosynthesis C-methylase UbiE
MTYRLAAKFYDLFGSKNDVEFYKELALQSGMKALELGVGTARVAISLARANITVVGIDTSVSMLRMAKEKLTKESEDVRGHVILNRGDMRSFELSESFPFIYIPASTFDHNVTVEDRKRTLKCIYRTEPLRLTLNKQRQTCLKNHGGLTEKKLKTEKWL